MKYNVEEGTLVPFWSINWCGDTSLTSSFYDLFYVCNCKYDFMVNMGVWHNGNWSWGDFGISLELHNTVSDRINCLQIFLSYFHLAAGEEDSLQ